MNHVFKDGASVHWLIPTLWGVVRANFFWIKVGGFVVYSRIWPLPLSSVMSS